MPSGNVPTHFLQFVRAVPIAMLTARVCRDFAHTSAVDNGVAADARKIVFGNVDPLMEAAAAKKSAAILSGPA